MEKYFHSYWPSLGLDRDAFLHLGMHPEDPEPVSTCPPSPSGCPGTATASARNTAKSPAECGKACGPTCPTRKSRSTHVTNGVHVPTWIEPKMELLFDKYLGPDWLDDHDDPAVWEG